jgi:hypothetical protein
MGERISTTAGRLRSSEIVSNGIHANKILNGVYYKWPGVETINISVIKVSLISTSKYSCL